MGDYLAKRRAETHERLSKLREELGDAARTARDRACVYVTGSFGRVEAGANSDLDLFIVGRTVGSSTTADEDVEPVKPPSKEGASSGRP